MEFFMNKENVNNYKSMIEDYDGSWIISKLEQYVKSGSSILELGMGTGADFELMLKNYKVLGTDNSPIFIEDYKLKNKNANVKILDATNINLEEKFDCVYTNKVLQHLTKEDFKLSIEQQHKVLNDKGKIFMTLWHGKYEEVLMFDGQIRITYYEEKDIKNIVKNMYNIITIEKYSELENDDSLLVVLEKL